MEPFALLYAPYSPALLLETTPAPQSECLVRNGVSFLGHYEGRSFVVERLLSTNPFDYLQYEPGMRC